MSLYILMLQRMPRFLESGSRGSERYTDDYFRQYERPEQTVTTIMDNLAKVGRPRHGAQPGASSQAQQLVVIVHPSVDPCLPLFYRAPLGL